ncbi:unnamed protein product, partial [Symbiodinium sp. CCMP2592]
REVVCVELPKEYSADHVLEAAQFAAASADVQILRGTAHRLRQGDVVRVRVNTEARTLDVSAFVIPHNVGTASRWLQEGRIVSLLHPVAGVLSFEVPRACDLDTSVLGALLRSVTPGQHVFVALPGADLLPHAAFVAAFPGQDCVTYRVTDASDPSAVGLHLAFSGVFESFPAFLESLLRSNRPAAALLRRLQPFGLSVLTWECTSFPGRADCRYWHVHVQADFARAREHLLSLSWAPPSVCGAGVTPDSASELVDLWCDAWHVKCLVACLPGFTVWALREGSRLYGMCTPVPSWEAVAQALSLSLWELPQTFLSSDSRVWPFPRDITGVAMQCVSVGYDSPEGVSQLVRNCEAETPSPPPPPGPLASAALGLPCLRRYSLLCALSLLLPVVSVRVMVEPAPLFSRLAESETLQTRRDFSRPCTMSWTHELARQTHGFALSAPQLGPVHLRVGARHLDQHLSAYLGAFLPDCEYGLHVAFDSSPQVLDLIVSPPSPYGWWILRDSIGCELLRPVVQHYTSHWARALITSVLPGLEGKLVDGVLKIVAARARLPSLLGSLALLLLCRHVASMQPPQLLALAPVAEASPPPPTTIRIWTLNINAPVDLPWRPQGYPTRWLRELMCRLHHIDDPGEFRPTHSTTDSSVQHVLFVPVVPATRPTVRFWLLHWGDAAAVTFGHSPFSWDVVSAHLRALFPGGHLPERSPALSYAGQLYPPGVALPDFPSGAVIQILIGALARIPGDDDPWNPDPLVVEGPYFRHVPSRGPALEPAILLDGHGNRRAAGASHVPLIDQEVQTDLSGNGTGLDHATVSRVHMLSQELSFHTSRLWAGLAEPDAEPAGESQPVLRLASQSTCAAVSPSTVDLLDIASVSNCRRQDRLSVVVLSLVCTRGLFGPSAFGRLLVLATLGAGSIISAPPASSDDEQSEDAGPPPVQAFNMSAAEPTPVSRPAGPPPPEPVNAPFQPRMWFLRAARPLEDYALGLWPSSVEREPAADEDTVRRVQADLLGLQRGLRTFAAAIPLGTPFCIHNPFTARQQCELVEYSAGPEINPFVLFRGHARSRGWADIVLLQPQPDATAVHLIGCPQAPGNAAVGIVLEGRLVPCCLPVCVGTAALRALQLDGSEYDLRPPEVQEGSSVVQFRNGDCLAVRPRSQSRSPPPPEQVAAFAALTSEAELAAGSPDIPFSSQGRPVLSWGCFSLIFCRFTPSMCLSLGLLAGAALAQGMHRPGGFPWGTDPINRDFSAITAEDPVYVVLHSPFLGVFPPYTASHDTRHGQVWAQFLNDDPGWASDFFPVWPGPAFNELSMVPVGQDAALVTIMLMWRGHHRATLTPRTMTVAWLTAFISRHINSPVDGISLPHGLAICELFDVPPAAFRFRNGDVVYIHDPPEDPSEPLEFVDPWHLQDGLAAHHAPWATGFQLMFGISVHLLRPNRPPLLASVSAGEAWCPESFTFTGTFRNHFPGMWTPVQWSGARALQLIEVHGVAAQVNVVAASPEGRLCRTVDRIASRDSLADQLHFLPGSLQVGGVPSYALNQACELRNGDVVSGDFARGACSGRPLLWGLALGLVPAFSSCRTGTFLSILLGSLGAHSGFFSRLLMLTWCLHGAQAMVPETSVLSQTTSSVIPPAAPPRVSVTVANPFAPWHRVEADPRHLFDDVMADAHRTLTSWHRGFAATGLVLEGPNGTQRQLQCYIMRLSLATTAGPPAMDISALLRPGTETGGFFLLHSVSWGGALSSLPNSLLSSSGFLNLCGERPPVPLAAAPARFFPPAIDFNDGEPYVPLGGWQPDNPDGPLARYFPGPRPLTARVLCPLRGWSETSFLDTTRSIEQEGTRHCGLWAHRFFPVRAVLPISQITVAPVAPYGLATVALHIEGCSAVAFASVDSSLDDIHRLAVRVFPHTRFWRVIAPPVLRTTIPNAHIRLRNGDAFSLLPEPSDPGATRYPLLQYASLDRARQVASWSLPFRFDSGGYVCLWYTGRRSGHSIRIRDTGYWDPEGPTFWSLNGRALSGSWVPVLSGDLSSLHLVHSTSTGEAHVLLLLPPDLEPQGLLLAGCNAYRAPPGWRLLPALQYVRADSPLRDGDVLVLDPTADTVWDPTGPPPQSLAGPAPGPVARPCWGPSSSAAAAISGRWAWLAVLSARWPRLLALACLVCAGQGMASALDLPEQPIRVGFFPWRAAAAAADLVDLTNRTEIDIVLLSPFTGPQEAGRLPTASTTGELNALTRSCDPAWGAEVAPVWPTAAIPALLVVPRPLTPDLVCLAVSSLDRHFSILVPCTTSVSWLGAALRFLQPMQTLSVRAPSTSDQGVRWRSGDLVVALPPAAFAPEYQPPCFHSDARGIAPFGLLISRSPPVSTSYSGGLLFEPSGDTHRQAAAGVLLIILLMDHAHLVLLPEDPSRVNVIVEADGHCWCALVTAVTDAWQLWTELPSLSSQPRVLGVPHQELRQGTTLRSGDVVSGCPGLSPSCWLPCSLGLAAWWALGSASSAPGYLLMFAGLLALPPVSGARLPHESGSRQWSLATSNCDGSAAEPPGFRHRLWDPARGLLGPFPGPSLFVPPALQEAAPAWSDFTRVRPPQDHHWVPVPSAPLFATVLLQCPPATRAALLPATCAVADLARASSHFIPDLSYVLAPPEAWCGTATTCTPTLFLRSGDVLTLASATWAPRLRSPVGRFWETLLQARQLAFWGSPFRVRQPGLLFAWSPGDPVPLTVPTTSDEQWDPEHCTFRPSLVRFSVGRWIPAARVDDLGLHLVPESPNLHWAHVLSARPPLSVRVVPRHGADGLLRDGDSGSPLGSAPSRTLLPLLASLAVRGRLGRHWFSLLSAWVLLAGLPELFPGTAALGFPPVSTHALARTPGPSPIGVDFGLLSRTSCYFRAWGAPDWHSPDGLSWAADIHQECAAQASLHQLWWTHDLFQNLPASAPAPYRQAFSSFPVWSGGVPDQVLIATDGSGERGGAWAFCVWVWWRHKWHRVGWFGAAGADTPWFSGTAAPGSGVSFHAELWALQAAGLWLLAWVDRLSLLTSAAPAKVTIAVDNASALQIAAGQAQASEPVTTLTRYIWQAVQSRMSTRFQHVHSHVGILPNTIADFLAGWAGRTSWHPWKHVDAALPALLQEAAPWLWLIPHAKVVQGRPWIRLTAQSLTHAPAGRGPAVQCPSTEVPCAAPSLEPQRPLPLAPSLSLRIVTANVQTMRDSCASFFNPSGHGQRRQYLYSQVAQLGLDVVCLQETRSKGGRWDTAGLLTWRSGAQKGSYGCEIWVRPQIVNPPLRLDDWRIACADPRLLVIVCKRADLPLAVVAAHAPHADRPVPEIHHFWSSLQSQLCQLPRALTLVLGLDANADLLWADDDHAYIGDALGNGEEGAGEQGLFDTIQRFGLLAPASFSDLQDGPGWSWEHTGGTRKRLDHILLQAGPWSCRRTRQLPELDILNGRRDHMPLLVECDLRGQATRPKAPAPPRATVHQARAIAADLWGALPSTFRHIDSVGAEVQALKTKHSCLLRALPRPPRRPIRQPYITAASVAALDRVRQAREQLPRLRTNLEWQQRRFLLQVWRLGCTRRHPDAAPLRPDPTGLQHARLLLQACNLHVRGLQQKAHYLARSDKLAHFRTLTLEATKHWEATGVPLESIRHLRWASRKAHERRSVHAAGGFDIDSELEAQFRDQEGASLVSPVQLSSAAERWMNEPRLPCAEAVPTLLQMEQMCVRQAAAKAPGPDGLRNELWRAQGASAGQWLWPLCVRIALQGREPFAFKAAIVCALYKKGPASLPANYRSIALLNGIAKLWHSHLRSTVGGHVLSRYEPMQLGGRKGVHTGFALAAFRCAWDLSISAGRCVAVVFVDIQAAYYEASRDLLFEGFPDDVALPEHHHLAGLVLSLQQQGALAALGVAEDVVALLRDCVALSHWSLSGSSNIFLASRGSRPGDGLADILFGALFAVGLQHIQRVATRQGIVHNSAGAEVGLSPGVKPIGWADDLAVMADFDRPADLLVQLPVLVGIILDTLRLLRFRVNLGAGKTEALVDIRGEGARAARGVLLTGDAMLKISDSDSIRLCPEYKYLGVAQLPRDTGRRDCELAAQRGAAAASLARTLLCSNCLPWELKRAWVAGRVLPSAYSSLAMSLADSGRATAPLAGLFDRTARILLSSWQVGHKLTTPLLRLLADITPPDLATTISQCRLCVQLFCKAPTAVREIVDAAWNRALPWCQALVAACMRVGVALEVWDPNSPPAVTVLFVHTHSRALLRACKALSKFGHRYFACAQLWDDLSTRKATQILGPPQAHRCPVCSIIFPSLHAVRAHMHRKHGVLSDVTAYMAGSVCLWCMHDFHSSDRLKYHLQSHRACLHGLRVTVGPVYQYGSGTKRKGRTAHRGVPPTTPMRALQCHPSTASGR